jgi:DNA-binding transcriptional LysR family regulator
MMYMNTTLDQWEVLRAVVHYGSFSSAATHLNRSQSTISYSLARLEEQTGVHIFELVGRKAKLTEAGRSLLVDVEPLLAGFASLEERARFLGLGHATSIVIAIDSLYPNERLFTVLAEFAKKFPHVRVKLLQSTFISSHEAFTTRGAHLCVTGTVTPKTIAIPLLHIQMLAVARADHPLNQLGRPLTDSDIVRHLAVIIESAFGPDTQSQPRNESQLYWPVNTIKSAVDAVHCGLCFGWLPAYIIQPYLDSGELVKLPLTTGQSRLTHLYLVHTNSNSARLEINALADLLGANRPPETI